MMRNQLLTPDNLQLSRPISEQFGILSSDINFSNAINCKLLSQVQCFIQASLSPATLRAYRADIQHFVGWGGNIPSTEGEVATYIASQADQLAVATLTRRLASLSRAHEIAGVASPTTSPLVRATMRGIRRTLGSAQKQAKPLLRDDLFAVLEKMGDDPKGIRDRALLLLGFAGGFRRSELVSLDVDDLTTVRQGMIVRLRRSKTDQLGEGRDIGVPNGRTRWCPVEATTSWLKLAAIMEGSVFRRIDRHGNVLRDRLSSEAVCLVIRERVCAADIDPTGYSGHSLRAGFATSAAQAGVSSMKIRAQTGHASDAMLARYVRDGELFIENAAGRIL